MFYVCYFHSDINKIQAGIGDKIGAFIQFTTNFVAGLIVALFYGWKLALVLLSTSPLLACCAGFMMFVSNYLKLPI